MRKLLKENFHVPKCGKVREKTIMTQVVMTVTIIAFCVAAMGFTAYAYFSHNVSSSHNFIKSTNFEISVKVQIQTNTGKEVQVITSNYKSHVANLKADTTYFVSLIPTERSATKTGFVIVTAEGCENRYHTEQLGVVGDSYTETVSFYLIPSADTKVTFLAHWGTSSFYGHEDKNNELYIEQGESVNILINNIPGATEPDTTPTTAATTTPTIIETTAATTTPTATTAPTASNATLAGTTVITPTESNPPQETIVF